MLVIAAVFGRDDSVSIIRIRSPLQRALLGLVHLPQNHHLRVVARVDQIGALSDAGGDRAGHVAGRSRPK